MRSSRRPVTMAAALLAFAAPIGLCAQTYTACRVPDVGAIYMIGVAGTPSECLDPSHVEFEWSESSSVADGSVTTAKLAADAVTSDKIADGTIGPADVTDNSLGSSDLADASVTSAEIQDGAVATADLADASVTSAKIAASAVGPAAISTDAVGASNTRDEPGIAVARNTSEIQFQGTLGTPFTTLVSVTITTPAAGYISVEGVTHGRTSGTAANAKGWVQISETPGGTFEDPWGVGFGSASYPTTGLTLWPISVSRTYEKATAGTYTFYLEATVRSDTAVGGVVATDGHYLVAKFFPTAYGAVQGGS